MSSRDRAISIITQLALATDGAVVGVALAYGAIQAWCYFRYNSCALNKVRQAKTFPISDLRSLLASSSSSSSDLVIVRGIVEAKSVIDGNKDSVLVSYSCGDKGVVLQKTQTFIYNDSRGLLAWTTDLRTFIGKQSLRNTKSTSIRTIPFVLLGTSSSDSDYVVVNLDSFSHPLPLTTVYHHLQPVPTSPYTFLQAISGHSYPVGFLDEEKLLPLGKEISAVGFCTLQDGNPHVSACQDLPYFLSDMTKDQMLEDLAQKTNILFWCGIVLGSMSLGVLGYAFTKNWPRWKGWIQQRQHQRSVTNNIADIDAVTEEALVDEETDNVPDGQLCVICLMRRKRSAFVPCGHFVCCHRCALSVERDSAPKCPLCRQSIRTSVRIYDS